MTRGRPTAGQAWYRQFWPWFLIGLPALSIVVSVTTMVLAIGHADPLVEDDWYKRGLAINQDLDREAAAARRHLAATLTIDTARGELVVRMDGAVDGDTLALALQHPTIATRDRDLVLARRDHATFAAPLGDVPAGRWYATLEPAAGDWRLAAPVTLAPDVPARLAPGA